MRGFKSTTTLPELKNCQNGTFELVHGIQNIQISIKSCFLAFSWLSLNRIIGWAPIIPHCKGCWLFGVWEAMKNCFWDWLMYYVRYLPRNTFFFSWNTCIGSRNHHNWRNQKKKKLGHFRQRWRTKHSQRSILWQYYFWFYCDRILWFTSSGL